MRRYVHTLPAERYPRLVAAAEPLTTCDDPGAYYELGLDLLLAGVEAIAARSPERS